MAQDYTQLNGDAEAIAAVKALYAEHDELPYISPKRDIAAYLEKIQVTSGQTVPKRNMVRLEEDVLPGHIIILWRVRFGTYTNQTVISKYFEYDYGIDAKSDIEILIDRGYVREMSAKESLIYLTAQMLKKWLKEKGVKGYSKFSKEELMDAVREQFTEEELAEKYEERGYALTDSGEDLLDKHPEVIDRHPKKKY
ncbi:hypothetical protein [Fundicoccus culcitae]|uniref:Rho termination factor N-terminal domain-containing protein n=1 Tax=Fundicoccus culcitae TaxID=2969821 RepID=A0ABY5P323_9LACT|nr:hypothetical protein [Fundicoccus culcitae]UUX33129.1 hypothetical protein NRE15_09465 [Fundicoccus culcitae]